MALSLDTPRNSAFISTSSPVAVHGSSPPTSPALLPNDIPIRHGQTTQTDHSRDGHTIPRTDKEPSLFLLTWLHSDTIHGYEFNEDVLFGREPDSDWLDGYINQPNSWKEVAKCLRSEIHGQSQLARSKEFRSHVDMVYWRGCTNALREVEEYYL